MTKYTEAKHLFHHNKTTFEQEKFMMNTIDEALEIAERVEQANTFDIASRITCKDCEADCDDETLHHTYPCKFIYDVQEIIGLALAIIKDESKHNNSCK